MHTGLLTGGVREGVLRGSQESGSGEGRWEKAKPFLEADVMT